MVSLLWNLRCLRTITMHLQICLRCFSLHTHLPSELLHKDDSILTEPKQGTLTTNHGTLVRPAIHDPHPDRPRPSLHATSLREPESITPPLHAHAIPCSQQPSSRDREPRIDLELPLLREELQRGNSELCPHLGTPIGSDGMEPSDTNTQSATSP